MSDRDGLARRAWHKVRRPKLLLSAAIAAIIVSTAATSGASAFGLGGFHLGAGAGNPMLRPNKGMTGVPKMGNGELGKLHTGNLGHVEGGRIVNGRTEVGNGAGRIVNGNGRTGTGKIGNGETGKVGNLDNGRNWHRPNGGVDRPDPGKGRVGSGDHPRGDEPQPPRWWHHPHFVLPEPVLPVNPALVSTPPSTIIPTPPNNGPALQPVKRSGGVPAAGERRYVPDEVVIELATTMTPQQTNALVRRHRLAILQTVPFQLGGTILVRGRITDRRAVPVVVRSLEADASVLSAQPNYLYTLIGDGAPSAAAEGDPSQYILDKLHLPQAHALATGANVLVAVIDSGIDVNHPDLAGDIADSYDAIQLGLKVHPHGTAIAGAIAAHGKLMGAAPAARILAVRAFSGTNNAQGTTMAIQTGLDWAVAHGARVVNMSFAGPQDPDIARAVALAHGKGVVMVAASGNKGAKSPPLFPAADPGVIAVTATNESDQLPDFANRGNYVAVAAPGVDLMLLAPNGSYQMQSGTSFSSAYVSGTVALMLQRAPSLTPDALREVLMDSAHHLQPKDQVGAGLVDAYQAVLSVAPVADANARPPVTPVADQP
jgi:subtilisin family serine protease